MMWILFVLLVTATLGGELAKRTPESQILRKSDGERKLVKKLARSQETLARASGWRFVLAIRSLCAVLESAAWVRIRFERRKRPQWPRVNTFHSGGRSRAARSGVRLRVAPYRSSSCWLPYQCSSIANSFFRRLPA